MKKLLITASTFPRWINDTEPRFIFDYAKAMSKYYEIHVLVPMSVGAKTYEIVDQITIHRFHYFPIHKFETLCAPGAIVPRIREKKIRVVLVPFLLFALLFQVHRWSKKVDIVNAHWLIPQGVVQYMCRTQCKYVVTGHGGDVVSINNTFVKWFKRKCLENASACVGVSSYICEKMQEIAPNCMITRIPMGFDNSIFNTTIMRDKIGDKKRIIFVGRLAEKKGVKYLIQSMSNIEAELFIVGNGPLKEELIDLAQPYNGKIHFCGAKTHDELPSLLASADLFVAPSIVAGDGDQEGLPVSIMEAMAMGLPVVAGKSGGTKDIVKDGINGYVVDATNVEELRNAINTILLSNSLRCKMSENAIKTAQTYEYSNIAYQYYNVIEKIFEKG